ncbi:MAG: RND transporter [Robiginitomaculum sp.]|nr:MAG: RND transporter [Robiginitomaculum sp.]
MKSLVAWWAKNTVAANLLMIAIVLMGAVGFNKLEREFFPTLTVNGMTVAVSWQGASPSDVEEQLITRIEDAISGLDGIDYIEATAREGGGSVNIRTKVRADYDKLLSEVKVRIDGINNMPPDAFRPTVHRWDARADYMYLALHGDVDRLILQRLTNDIRNEMAKIPGGELVRDISKLDEEVTIEITEDALRRYGLTFRQVASAISGNSVNLSAGKVETSIGSLQMKARNLANTKEQFENIIIRQTQDGGKVYLKDIAHVIDRFQDLDFSATYKGQTATMFQVLTPDTINVTKAGKGFRDYIEKKNKELPPGIELSMWMDGSEIFDARMNLIGSNALMGMAMVMIILVLFLRPAVAFWVTAGILVSFAGALAVMPYLGVSLNMISTFAILLVIGIVVDDAIVVGESIHFHVEHGITGEKGAISGTNMVIKPVFFAVITTIMTFMPWMMLSGPMVAVTRQITLVVIAALIFSLIEAFFILPAHLAHLKPMKPVDQLGRFGRFQRMLSDGLLTFAKVYFRPFTAMIIKFRYATFAFFVGLMILTFGIIGSGLAKVEMFNNPEGDMIVAEINFPEGTSFKRVVQVKEALDAAVQKVNDNAQADFGVDFELITAPGGFAANNKVQAFLGLAKAETRTNVSSKKIAEKLEEYLGPIPDAWRVQLSADQGFSSGGRGVTYGITSNDTAALTRATKDLKTHMDAYGNVSRTWDSLESSAQEMRFTLKPGAERYGISLADLTRQVREAFYGLQVQRLPRNGEDVRVMLRYPKADRDSIDSLEQLRIRGPNGVEVPLYSIADVSFAPGVSQISRRDRKRTIRVGARVKGGPEAINTIKSDMDENFFPDWEIRHPKVSRLVIDDDDMEKTFKSELILFFAIVMFMMYGLLAIAFKSYAQPLLIMIAIPFAFVGMVFGSMIVDVPLGMMSIFGFFAAAGVAVNDNLVLIDYINRLRDRGVGAYQAVLDACVSRFRPILLTSVTTFVGIMPMLAEKSVQAQFLKPLVVALAFGVLFDFFLTLILVPAMYGIGVDIKRFFKGIWTGVKQPGLGATYDPELAVVLEGHEADEIRNNDAPNTPKAPPVPAE